MSRPADENRRDRRWRIPRLASAVRLRALTHHDVIPVMRKDWPALEPLISGVDAVVHLAGINRAKDSVVENGNAQLAQDLASAVQAAQAPPAVVFANSIQMGNGTPYGNGKARAAEILRRGCEDAGSTFADVLLPNLFREHGRPDYNSFVATFVDRLVRRTELTIKDREVELLHIQDAAAALMDAVGSTDAISPPGTSTTVQQVYETLLGFRDVYGHGEIPALCSPFDVALFNTYRAAMFPRDYPLTLQPRTDERGSLIETVRSHGGQGQTFVSTTKPGATRGEHFHLRKVERFAVVQGCAKISLRKLLTNEVACFDVSGDLPTAVDMPTLWVHSITNTGNADLLTMFWTNELFNPDDRDTYHEAVQSNVTT